jgi:hypothetical protein
MRDGDLQFAGFRLDQADHAALQADAFVQHAQYAAQGFLQVQGTRQHLADLIQGLQFAAQRRLSVEFAVSGDASFVVHVPCPPAICTRTGSRRACRRSMSIKPPWPFTTVSCATAQAHADDAARGALGGEEGLEHLVCAIPPACRGRCPPESPPHDRHAPGVYRRNTPFKRGRPAALVDRFHRIRQQMLEHCRWLTWLARAAAPADSGRRIPFHHDAAASRIGVLIFSTSRSTSFRLTGWIASVCCAGNAGAQRIESAAAVRRRRYRRAFAQALALALHQPVRLAASPFQQLHGGGVMY